MIFKELQLTRFGKFKDRHIPFSSGLNIVIGKNESGKTTLFQALLGILFGFKTDRDRYRPWSDTSQYRAKLSLQTDHDLISIERDFLNDTVWMTEESISTQEKKSYRGKVAPMGRSSERNVYLQKIQKLFGFSEPDIFKHSLFIEQRSLSNLPTIQTASELKHIMSNISEFKYDDIIRRLEDRYFELTKKNPQGLDKRNDRLIENIQQQIEELSRRVRQAHHDENRLCEIGKKVSDIKYSLHQHKEKIWKLSRSISSLEQLMQQMEHEESAQKQFSELSKKKALVEKLVSQRKRIHNESPKMNRLLFGGMMFGLGLLPILYFSTPIHGFWLTCGFIALAIASGIYYHGHKKSTLVYVTKDLRIKSQLEVLPPLDELQSQFKTSEKRLSELERKKFEMEKQVVGYNGARPLNKSKDLQTLITEQQAQMETLEFSIRKFEKEYQQERQQYFLLSKGLESPFTLEEDLYDLHAKAKHLHIKAQALYTAKEMLREIVVQFRREHLHLFADKSKELFQKISSPEFHKISVNDINLSPSVHSLKHQQAEPVLMSSLSCGTQDQLFFSMKFALLDLLSTTQKLPLLLDDPFVNFDHDRKRKVLDLLLAASKERQIFIFTYDPWYVELYKDKSRISYLDNEHAATA